MKILHSFLTALVASAVFTPLALAGSFPTWDTQINNKGRFQVPKDFDSAVVFDRETGLVWERSPSLSSFANWLAAQSHCNNSDTGGRMGWRLPTVQELTSLRDPDQSNPSLPPSHPFNNVQFSAGAAYWSATTYAADTTAAWVVQFSNATGGVGNGNKAGLSGANFVWCVRGGQGPEAQ